MVMARLHIICGNCGCNDMFDWRYEPKANDMGDGTFQDGVYLSCNNCATIHDLDDNAAPKNRRTTQQEAAGHEQ